MCIGVVSCGERGEGREPERHVAEDRHNELHTVCRELPGLMSTLQSWNPGAAPRRHKPRGPLLHCSIPRALH